MLKVRDLKVDFEHNKKLLYAVRGVSFDLEKGEVLGIVGESGSGKSVTASSLLRLISDNGLATGEILFEGKSVFDLSPKELSAFRGRKIGMIFQEPGRSFDPIYNIENVFAETFKVHFPEMSKSQVKSRTIELLKEVNLPSPEERLSNFPHQFSGGQLQRIMIALALASDPDILIADEPTTALDVTIQAGIVNLLARLKEKRGLSIIFITHDIDLIAGLADRLLVMYGGEVMEEGEASVLYNKPNHPYTQALIRSVPRFGSHYSEEALEMISGSVPDPRFLQAGCPFAPRCPHSSDKCHNEIPWINGSSRFRCIIKGDS